ncbi:MAG: hypothetical protein N4J56_006994 [Chroococcidiopsis sp. SAG 2025]|uniref:beta/gamma crystallin domain-containing protein n=1 Tax=Chroococcidiopsis sp. SAG 2025 TaxID=171389 RepID=UPI0029374993|nr:beta/gamma crystallin domain-containing protein [Chroococcidiopsis sp. SAG 2025]MDV2997289.1 hypothetical protein [Chroococcidiopsis sp. SAG 2025]
MDFKMPKIKEQSEQLQNKELEAIAGGRLNNLVKNLSLRGKVARWAAVAASVVGISVSMAMPAEAINRVPCHEDGYFSIYQMFDGRQFGDSKCFANAGDANVVIADVHTVSSGNNAGYIIHH